MRLMLTALILLTSFSAYGELSKSTLQELKRLDQRNLKSELKQLVQAGHSPYGYREARKVIFEKIDNDNGEVCCVYSDNKCLKTRRLPNHTVMNIEHTWPQSLGARGIAKSDLHHLFPTDSQSNSRRSNLPFCEVEHVEWYGDGSQLGIDHRGEDCFEPPAEHKGDVARAMFYFAIRYDYRIDPEQERVLRKWHELDRVDQRELERHEAIVRHQRNRNVFIENPEIVELVQDF